MLDAAAEQEGQAIGSEPPHRGPDTERWPLGGHNLQLHRGSDFQLGRGSDLGAKRADVQGARQVAHRSRMDENGPGNASAGVLPPVLLSRSFHECVKWQFRYQIKRHMKTAFWGPLTGALSGLAPTQTSLAQHLAVPAQSSGDREKFNRRWRRTPKPAAPSHALTVKGRIMSLSSCSTMWQW